MRDPFAYESDIPSLQPILVPDPISRTDWEEACETWKISGNEHSFLEWLVIAGILPERSLMKALAEFSESGTLVSLDGITTWEQDPECILLQQFGFLALRSKSGKRWIAGGPDFPPALPKYLGHQAEKYDWVLLSPIRQEFKGKTSGEPHIRKSLATASSAEEWLTQLMMTSRAEGASDLYLERSGASLRARVRTGNGLRELGAWHDDRAASALRLLKEWSGISTAEKPLPGDGRLSRQVNNRTVTYRCSHIRTDTGESFALREVSGQTHGRSMDALGMPQELQEALRECIHWNPGFILFTGPTCSGKTTTQFSQVEKIRDQDGKILTIEDPVEYQIDGVLQCNVDQDAGWTFDRAIRAFLRQDPDWIVIGEIRDRESAHAACRAALTGHGVLATLHAKSSADAIARLRAWDIPEGMLSEALRLIVNQRLAYCQQDKTLRAKFNWQLFQAGNPLVPSGIVKIR